MEEALSAPWDNKIVTVHKQVAKSSMSGVSVEQSDLQVSEVHLWRTICFESNSIAKVKEMLYKQVRGNHLEELLRTIPDSIVQGYPAFIKQIH